MLSKLSKEIDGNDTFILILSILIGAWLRIQYMFRDFWHDEAFQWLYSQKPIEFIFQSNDVHPPLFSMVAKGILAISTNIMFLRCVMLFISVLFVWQFYVTIKELLNEKSAIYATSFLILSPTFAYYSTEFRSYIFTMLLTIIQVRYFSRLTKAKDFEAGIYYGLCVLMLYSHIMTALIIFVQILYLIIKNKVKEVMGYSIVVVSCIPLVFYLVNTIPKIQSFWFKDIGITSFISTFFYIISRPDQPIYHFIALSIFGVISYALFKYHKQTRITIYLMISYIVIPIVLMFVISLLFPFYHHRYFLFGGMFIYAIAGWAITKSKFDLRYFYALPIAILIVFPVQLSTPLQDVAECMKTQHIYPVVHLSTFSQSPMKVYLPMFDHYLKTELTEKQRFTAGGSVIEDWELSPPEHNVYVFSATPHKDAVCESEGLYVYFIK
jgi:uncharacterized membrane protein